MPEYFLRRTVYDETTKGFYDDPDQLISHLHFESEFAAWKALRQLISKGFDATGWYVRQQPDVENNIVEHEAA